MSVEGQTRSLDDAGFASEFLAKAEIGGRFIGILIGTAVPRPNLIARHFRSDPKPGIRRAQEDVQP
jgi:hypothetical protein